MTGGDCIRQNLSTMEDSRAVRVTVVMNPTSGSASRRQPADAAVARVRTMLARLGAVGDVQLTRHAGHAVSLARLAVDAGTDVVCAWGGDGTVHEVASALAHGRGVLAVVPAGSGNGFARALEIPLDHEAALAVAVRGVTRVVDVGEINGRLFFATAGIGLDGAVAHAFAKNPGGARGLRTYLLTGLGSLVRFQPQRCSMVADGTRVVDAPATLIAVANTRQWGNGACIAPAAVPDDGRLDATIVGGRSTLVLAAQAWRLWSGAIGRLRGVTTLTFREASIECAASLPMHVDGEPAGFVSRIEVRVRPQALAVKVPA